MRRISAVLRRRTEERQGLEGKQKAKGHVRVEAILFTDERGILGMTDGAEELVRMVSENHKKEN